MPERLTMVIGDRLLWKCSTDAHIAHAFEASPKCNVTKVIASLSLSSTNEHFVWMLVERVHAASTVLDKHQGLRRRFSQGVGNKICFVAGHSQCQHSMDAQLSRVGIASLDQNLQRRIVGTHKVRPCEHTRS